VPTPLPICHLNGALLPLREARISPLDRCFLFGDGVYEVAAARRGQPRRLSANLARLRRSLSELRIAHPHTDQEWSRLIEELIAANGGGDVYVYLQVSRGAEYGRNHAPPADLTPTVFAFCSPLLPPSAQVLERGVSCITAQDIRWARRDIKSVALLANVLLKQQALAAGADEAILLQDGFLTEASTSSIYVVSAAVLHMPPNGPDLLPGTTRGLIEELADRNSIARREGAISERELRDADEVWLSAATRGVIAVTRIDGRPVGSGVPGPVWRRMYQLIEDWWNR